MDESGGNSSSTSRSSSTVGDHSDANSRSISSISPLLLPSHGSMSPPLIFGHRGILRSVIDHEMEEECWSCLIIPITLWFFGICSLRIDPHPSLGTDEICREAVTDCTLPPEV